MDGLRTNGARLLRCRNETWKLFHDTQELVEVWTNNTRTAVLPPPCSSIGILHINSTTHRNPVMSDVAGGLKLMSQLWDARIHSFCDANSSSGQ
jgi:hypothetical protein